MTYFFWKVIHEKYSLVFPLGKNETRSFNLSLLKNSHAKHHKAYLARVKLKKFEGVIQ